MDRRRIRFPSFFHELTGIAVVIAAVLVLAVGIVFLADSLQATIGVDRDTSPLDVPTSTPIPPATSPLPTSGS